MKKESHDGALTSLIKNSCLGSYPTAESCGINHENRDVLKWKCTDMLDIACCRTARAVVVAADFCHPLTLFVISNLPTYIDMQKGHMS